jgi:chemotaxis protein methyltransferase CheR
MTLANFRAVAAASGNGAFRRVGMAFTFFFRDIHTIEHATDFLVAEAAGRSAVRVWDAGCAMGQEPYTLALVLAEKMNRFAFRNLRIDATDIDGSDYFGDIIGDGVYPWEQLQRIPAPYFAAHFEPAEQERHFRLKEHIRQRIRFQRHDLLSLKPAGEGYSMVLCKNVLLHFSAEERERVIAMFHDALAPGGALVTEQTQKLPAGVAHLFRQLTSDAQVFCKIE